MVTLLGTRLSRAFPLLAVIHTVLGHGHDKTMDMAVYHLAQGQFPNMTGSANMTALLVPQSYFAYADHAGLMMAHIIFMVIGWFFVLPIGTPRRAACIADSGLR